MPLHAMRETTSLGGERAQQAAYSLPSQRSSFALSFPHPPHSLGKRADEILSHDFMRQTRSFPFCAASWERAALHRFQRGMGKQESGGLGEKTRRGRGISMTMRPPSLGCLPKRAAERHCVRKISTTTKGKGIGFPMPFLFPYYCGPRALCSIRCARYRAMAVRSDESMVLS